MKDQEIELLHDNKNLENEIDNGQDNNCVDEDTDPEEREIDLEMEYENEEKELIKFLEDKMISKKEIKGPRFINNNFNYDE